MATKIHRPLLVCCRRNFTNIRQFSNLRQKSTSFRPYVFIGLSVTGFASWQLWSKRRKWTVLHARGTETQDGEEQKKEETHTNYREIRFHQFASVEYKGLPYMTPQDFLESVTEQIPRPRRRRMMLHESQVAQWLKNTPTKKRGSNKLFTDLFDKGLISYTEYLFLLCVLTSVGSHLLSHPTQVLARHRQGSCIVIAAGAYGSDIPFPDTLVVYRMVKHGQAVKPRQLLSTFLAFIEPQSGFRIAFNMFDTDGNQIVDKKEFLVLESFFTLPPQERKFVPRERQKLQALLDLQQVFSKEQPQRKVDEVKTTRDKSVDPVQDTTLLVHFFGSSGRDVLKFDDFYRFMENLQTEVIGMEFAEFSRGLVTISEEDFARILLRYTKLSSGDIEDYISRVRSKIPEEKGITFNEFKQFCQFLNNLDDFTIAMKMYTYADQSVSEEDFQRAVLVCTGFTLSPHLVHTVFQIFDVDGDGHLSHKEFISIMKDRLHRGSRSHLMSPQGTWSTFKTCVRGEVKSY